MESNSRSPIFSDFGELLEGIVTVRAFAAENRFLNSLHRKIDITTKVTVGFYVVWSWPLMLLSDVVFLLDDEPLATSELWFPWWIGSPVHILVLNRDAVEHWGCRVGWNKYHKCDVIHDVRWVFCTFVSFTRLRGVQSTGLVVSGQVSSKMLFYEINSLTLDSPWVGS